MGQTQITALIVAGVLILICLLVLLAIHIFHKRLGQFDGVNESASIGFEKPNPARKRNPNQLAKPMHPKTEFGCIPKKDKQNGNNL